MIAAKPTEHLAGITLEGDYDDFYEITKRLVQQPDAYKNMKRGLEYSAKAYKFNIHELHDPKLEYPEEIEW